MQSFSSMVCQKLYPLQSCVLGSFPSESKSRTFPAWNSCHRGLFPIGDGFLLLVQEGSTSNDVTYPLSRWSNRSSSSWLTTATSLAFFTSRSRSSLWPCRALGKKYNRDLRPNPIQTSLCNEATLPASESYHMEQLMGETR